jgi:hypothetical protein
MIADEIVARVAELQDSTPMALRPLQEVVDTTALETVFKDTEGDLTFRYLDYDVTVFHTGNVRVSPTERTHSDERRSP